MSDNYPLIFLSVRKILTDDDIEVNNFDKQYSSASGLLCFFFLLRNLFLSLIVRLRCQHLFIILMYINLLYFYSMNVFYLSSI